jgi:hypothetical protein
LPVSGSTPSYKNVHRNLKDANRGSFHSQRSGTGRHDHYPQSPGVDIAIVQILAGAKAATGAGDQQATYAVITLGLLQTPVICAVNGVAAGAGATLALGCDIVLAARSAKFVMAFSKLGLVPDCGGSWAQDQTSVAPPDGAPVADWYPPVLNRPPVAR